MALTPQEELELLQLEEEEAQAGGQTSPTAQPEQPQTPPESKMRGFARKVAGALPVAGAVGLPTVAALGSGGTSLPASALLAGLGGGAGVAGKQMILRALGDKDVPQTSGEAAKEIGIEGAKDAALTFLGGKALQGAGKVAKVAFAPSLAKSGAAVGEAEIAAGARLPRAVEKLATVGRTAEKARGEIDKIGKTLENLAEQKAQPTARYLTRQKDRLSLILNKFGKNNNAKDQIGQDAFVKASAIKKRIVDALNAQIPERVGPASQYAAGKTREKIVRGAVSAAKKAFIPASILGGIASIK